MAPTDGFSGTSTYGVHNAYEHVALHDAQMLEEIELLGNLIVIATSTSHVLSPAEIDSALGLVASSLPAPTVPAESRPGWPGVGGVSYPRSVGAT